MQTAAVDTLVTDPLFDTAIMLSSTARMEFAVDLDVFVLLLWAGAARNWQAQQVSLEHVYPLAYSIIYLKLTSNYKEKKWVECTLPVRPPF